MAVKKRDVVLVGKNAAGDTTIDMPITRLGNIEDNAEVKENPSAGDYIPIIDSEDGGQMKKIPYTPAESSGTGETHRFYEKNVTLTGGSGSNTLAINLNIFADITEIEVNGGKRRIARGRIKINSYTVKGTPTSTVLNVSDGSGVTAFYVPVIWNSGSNADGEVALILGFSELTNGEEPFKIFSAEIHKQASIKQSDQVFGAKNYFPFWLEMDI